MNTTEYKHPSPTGSYNLFASLEFGNIEINYRRLLEESLQDNVASSRPKNIPGEINSIPLRSTAYSLLKHVGTWIGDDSEECLEKIYKARGRVKF